MQHLYAGRWGLISAAAKTIQSGQALDHLPALLKRIIKEDAWREFVTPLGEVEQFETFAAFVESQWGLHTSLPTLSRLCGDDIEALDALDQVSQEKQGPKKRKQSQQTTRIPLEENVLFPETIEQGKIPDIIRNLHTPKYGGEHHGTSRAYALRRLRAQCPDIHARVLAKEISPRQGMIEAGFRHEPTPLDALQRSWRKVPSPDRLQFLVTTLTSEEREALRTILNQDKEPLCPSLS